MAGTRFKNGLSTTSTKPSSGQIITTTLTVTGNATTSGYNLDSVATDLTAAGTNLATALQLAAQSNNITTAAASTGVKLPTGVIGMTIRVFNNGANTTAVYASNSETINGTAGATGVTQATGKVADYTFVKALTWISVAVN